MEARVDVNVLLEGIRCQQDDIPSVKQALLTLASMCSTNDEIKDYLRDCDGLVLVSQQLTSTTYTEIKEAALYTLACAVDKNVYSQKHLTSSGLFNFLYPIIQARESSYKLKQTACFLLLSLVANNGHGQMLLRKSNCLALLFELFKTTLPRHASSLECLNEVEWFDNVTPKQRLDLWTTITSVLCVAVNNPQNDENQRQCASVFPLAFVLMQNHPVIEIIRPITSLVGLAVANNVHNQQRVVSCGGLEAIVNCLHRAVNRIHDGNEHAQLAVCLTNTLDAVIADNESAAIKCGELGAIPLLLKQVQSECMDTDLKLNAVMTLGHCVELCVANQKELVGLGGVPILIRSLGTTQENEELNQSIKYVLQACTSTDKSSLSAYSQAQLIKELPDKTNLEEIQRVIEEETDPRTDIKVLEKKFQELERKLISQNTTQGLTLSELLNFHAAAQMPSEPSEIERQHNESLEIQLEKEKSLRQKFQLEALHVRKELNKKLREEEVIRDRRVEESSNSRGVQKDSRKGGNADVEILTSKYKHLSVGKNVSDMPKSGGFQHMEQCAAKSSPQLTPMGRPLSTLMDSNTEPTDSDFVRPTGSVPKATSYSVKLKTLRRNKYTPRKQKMSRRLFRCSSPVRSEMSEFDTRLVSSAEVDETDEIEDLLSDEASSIWTNDNLNMTLSTVMTEASEVAGDDRPRRISDHGSRDTGAGDAYFSRRNNQCPGCQAPESIGGQLLNSRTYNNALENNRYTCEEHRRVRQLERKLARATSPRKDEERNPTKRLRERTLAKDSPQGRDVYSIPSTSENVSPLGSSSSDKMSSAVSNKSRDRRPKVPFTEEEEQNLRHGVSNLGRFWTQILNTYRFHPSRTPVDLKDKFRNLKNVESISPSRDASTRRATHPFSMTEERRLRRGVRHFRYNWSAILRTYKFYRGRTAVDLKDKWRNMTKNKLH